MIIEGKVKVPDTCGNFCPYYGKPADMSSPCFRCPIFNCKKLPDDNDGLSPLVKPEEFSSDVAQSYVDWWGENQLPEIKKGD